MTRNPRVLAGIYWFQLKAPTKIKLKASEIDLRLGVFQLESVYTPSVSNGKKTAQKKVRIDGYLVAKVGLERKIASGLVTLDACFAVDIAPTASLFFEIAFLKQSDQFSPLFKMCGKRHPIIP